MSGFLGIVCGLKSEARALGDLAGHERIRIAISGASAERADAHASRLTAEGARALLSFGVSGGLNPDMTPGQLILATQTSWGGGAAHPADQALLSALETEAREAGLDAVAGPIAGSDTIIATAADKHRLYTETQALAVDMESHAVARVARDAGLPSIAIRAVADPHDRAIPPSAANGVAPDGSVRPLRVIAAALLRPGDFPHLMEVGRDSARATESLRRSARHLVPLLLRVVNFG